MLTTLTRDNISRLFAPELHETVAVLLQAQCGNNLPLCGNWTPEQLERLQIAALKCSGGSLEKLQEAIRLAQQDWRDLLMMAGFGHDPVAHRYWQLDAED
jgi:hypothetical protein